MVDLLTLLPWLVFVLSAPFVFRRRPRLRDYAAPAADEAPSVSVIVPARNEVHNIAALLRSLLASTYPNFEIVVVDDRSEDGTGEVLRAMVEQGVERLRVVHGAELPDGWFGKPWACWQGYRAARGELLLFTDADTRHEPELLGLAVGALQAERADLVSILPRQLMESFWERIVMPQFLLTISLRYRDASRVNRTHRARDVIANGQFILVRRDAYEAVGGHEAVRGEVAEDLRLAQRFVEARRRVFLAHAEDLMATRMYRSLRELLEGWTKNVAIGARQTVDPWLRPAVPWLIAAFLLLFWVLPPGVLAASLFFDVARRATAWSAGATGLSLFFWLAAHFRLRIPRSHALLYPLGAAIAAGIFIRSALRGERVVWKGRTYGG
jgi:chlorobactene glucosyltransferase